MRELLDGIDILQIGFYSLLGYHVAQELATFYSEGALSRVKFHAILPENGISLAEVSNVLLFRFTFHKHVIDINFHGFPNFLSKHLIDQPLVSGTGVL